MPLFAWRMFLFSASVLAIGSVSRADIVFFGNARAFAMGGAGLAIVDRKERTTPINPAALALYDRKFHIGFPGIGLHANGIGLKQAYDHIISRPDSNDAVTLARDFGGRPSDFGVGLTFGARFGHWDATATGVGIVHVIPNAALQTWAHNANGDITQLTGDEKADLLGAAVYSLPVFGAAERISPAGSPTRIEVGARVKLSRAVYTHYLVSSSNIANNTPASPAPELGGGTTLTKDGIGVDLGFLSHPRAHNGFSGALVVTNLVDPRFVFNGTDVNGAAAKYDVQPRSVSVGSAYETGRAIAAYDMVDLGRAYGDTQQRIGIEYSTKRVAFRGGYSSARGFTVGFGWGFLEFAYGARAPLEITQYLHF
jgi:hypothetical protein